MNKDIMDVCKGIQKFYIDNPSLKDGVTTLPDVFRKSDSETFISAWLAYLLDPHKNGLGKDMAIEPLRLFLEIVKEKAPDIGVINTNPSYVGVVSEYSFKSYPNKRKDDSRIDILITTQDFIICIENKIKAGEHGDQSDRYAAHIEEIAKEVGKRPVCIFLKPKKSKATLKNNSFITVTYDDLHEALKDITPCPKDTLNYHLFNEFISHMNNRLIVNKNVSFPEIKEDSDLDIYLENFKAINECVDFGEFQEAITIVKKRYDEHVKALVNWVNLEMPKLQKGNKHKYYFCDNPKNFKCGDPNYWVIVGNDAWRELDFHFELIWSVGESFIGLEEIEISAHLESSKGKGEVKIDKKAVDQLFYGRTDMSTIKVPTRPIPKQKIKIASFITKEAATETLKTIINTLNDRKTYTKYGKDKKKYEFTFIDLAEKANDFNYSTVSSSNNEDDKDA